MRNRSPGRRPAGFTLMEVMVALSIVAILGSLVWGSFSPIHQAKEIVEAEADRYHGVRLSLSRMSRDLSMAFLSDRFDTKRFRERPTLFVSDDAGDDGDSITFTTFAHERLYEDAKESDQALVEYRVGRDPDDREKSVLFRREKTVIDDQPEDGGAEVVLAEGIEGLNLEFWDVKDKEWVSEWDSTDLERKNHLPERVRITLVVKDEEGKERKFSTQTKVFLRFPLGR